VNLQTLRYYERRGLPAGPPRSLGGHRLYPAEAVTAGCRSSRGCAGADSLEPGEGAGAVAVQPQAVFDGGDQGGPFLAAGEGAVRMRLNRPAICSPRVPDSSPVRSRLIPRR
jgi:hypothetical protein